MLEDAAEGGVGRESPDGDFHPVRENRRHQTEEEREGHKEGDEAAGEGKAGEGEAREEGEGEGERAREARQERLVSVLHVLRNLVVLECVIMMSSPCL